jgi:hypothetical protein
MPQSGSPSLRDGVSVIWERPLPSALTVKMSRSPVAAEKRAKMIFCPSGDQAGWLQPNELGSENAPPHDSKLNAPMNAPRTSYGAGRRRAEARARGRSTWLGRQGSNRLARTSAREEEDDLALREKDHPAVDSLRDDRLDTVGEELLRAFALSGL